MDNKEKERRKILFKDLINYVLDDEFRKIFEITPEDDLESIQNILLQENEDLLIDLMYPEDSYSTEIPDNERFRIAKMLYLYILFLIVCLNKTRKISEKKFNKLIELCDKIKRSLIVIKNILKKIKIGSE